MPRTVRSSSPSARRWRPLTLLLAVALVASACSGSRSVEAFCDRLHEGERAVKAVAADAGAQDEPLLGLALLLGALGEYQGMVDDLADVAPSEIRSDMERARDSFRRQTELTSGARGLEALAFAAVGGFIDGLSNRTAFENVDEFAAANCGMTVFSLTATATAGAPAGDSDDDGAAMSEEAPCPGLGFVSFDATSRQLAAALGTAGLQGVDGLDGLATAARELDPPAINVGEALGRINWGDGSVNDLAQEINDAVLDVCSRPLFDADAQTQLTDLYPIGYPDVGLYALGTYEPACEGGRLSYSGSQELLHNAYNGTHAVVWCQDAPIVLNLEDGTPFRLEGSEHLDIADNPPVLTDRSVFWQIREEVPASGLDAAGEEQVLLRQDLFPPFAKEELLRVTAPTSWADDDERAWLLDATGDHILLGTSDELRVLQGDGTVVLTAPSPAGWGRSHVVDGVWATGGDGAPLVDVRAGVTFTPPGAEGVSLGREGSHHIVDRCDARAFVAGGRSGWVIERDGPTSLAATPAVSPGGSIIGALPDQLVTLSPMPTGRPAQPLVYDLEGNEIWRRPDGAGRAALFNGKLLVQGQTGEVFEVDPVTDEVTTALVHPNYIGALFDNQTLHIDQRTGESLIFTHTISGRNTDHMLNIYTHPCAG